MPELVEKRRARKDDAQFSSFGQAKRSVFTAIRCHCRYQQENALHDSKMRSF